MTLPSPFNPDDPGDMLADLMRRMMAETAARFIETRQYSNATQRDQADGYINGMAVGALGAIVAIIQDGDEEAAKAHLLAHFDYYWTLALTLNGRTMSGSIQ